MTFPLRPNLAIVVELLTDLRPDEATLLVSADRTRIAGWLGGAAGAGGAGIAMLVCCTTTAAVAGGGLAAAGGLLRSPWLITAGLIVAALAVAAIVVRRAGHTRVGEDCCPPAMSDPDTAATTRTGRR